MVYSFFLFGGIEEYQIAAFQAVFLYSPAIGIGNIACGAAQRMAVDIFVDVAYQTGTVDPFSGSASVPVGSTQPFR